jgi:hypothetical protein
MRLIDEYDWSIPIPKGCTRKEGSTGVWPLTEMDIWYMKSRGVCPLSYRAKPISDPQISTGFSFETIHNCSCYVIVSERKTKL